MVVVVTVLSKGMVDGGSCWIVSAVVARVVLITIFILIYTDIKTYVRTHCCYIYCLQV